MKSVKCLCYLVSGGDPGQPNGAVQTQEQGATGGEQTASAAAGESGKVSLLPAATVGAVVV